MSVRHLALSLLAAALLVLAAAVPASAERAFTQRYATGGIGDIARIGNTLVSCATSASTCAAARAGTATNLNNNDYTAAYIDVDSDGSTFDSSSATLSLPAGATVQFAGLYFGGRTAAGPGLSAVKFKAPGDTAYADLIATVNDTAATTSAPDFYQGFVDVTARVAAAGTGTYTVGNVESDLVADRGAGWGLIVVYKAPGAGRHNLFVFDGLQTVAGGDTDTITLTGLKTPTTGIVGGTIGALVYEGDLGTNGDTLRVGAAPISDALNPLTNVFNSTIGSGGTRVSAKTPDYVNQLGFDLDAFALPALAILANATTADLTLSSTGDVYVPGAITVVTDAESDPPDTSFTGGPADGALVNTRTPTFTFTSTEAGSSFECKIDTGAFAACASPYTTPSLADGSHTVTVRSIDSVGNADPTPVTRTITVDATVPDTSITAGPSGNQNTTSARWTFTSPDSSATFECSLDAAAYAACTSPQTYPGLTQGTHTFAVRAKDPAGNIDASPATRTIVVDSIAPDTTIGSGPTSAVPATTRTPAFTFSADQSGSSFECRVDGGAFAACGSPYTTASLSDGSHTFEVRATDAFGNVDATPASQTFSVDATPPNTTVTAPANNALVGTATPQIAFTSTKSGSTFMCKIDAGSFAPCASPFTAPTLADGTHTVTVYAVDANGLADATPATVTFTVDTTLPDTTITNGPAPGSVTKVAAPAFAFTGSKASSTFECRVDNDAYAPCASPTTTGTLADGSHTFAVRSIDALGNVDQSPATRTFTVDTTPPATAIDSGPADGAAIATDQPTFDFSADQTGSSFECSVDGAAFSACSSPLTPAALTDGSHTFSVRAIDPAGNVDATPATRTFTVDTVAPGTNITAGPSGPTNATSPSWAFTSSDATATFECSLDGAAYAACTSPATYPGLSDGEHTFSVRAVDAAGNQDATPATRTIVIDRSAPDTTVTTKPDAVGADATPTFAFTSGDGTATFECRIDDGAYAPCTSPFAAGPLTDGEHTFDVRAVDPAGNADATPIRVTFTVDTTAPDTSLTSGPANGATVKTATPTFGLASDTAGATFECRLDGGDWKPCTSPYTAPALADGSHTLDVRAIDAAGNVDATPATVTFTVDTTVPAAAPPAQPDPPASAPAAPDATVTPADPAPMSTPSPTPVDDLAPADEDLGTIPGSLVAAARCQLLGGTGQVRARRIPGVGLVRVRLRSNATSRPGTPLRVSLLAPRRLAGAGFTLDGRRMRARLGRFAIAPARLAGKRRHVLATTLRTRTGKRVTIRLRFRTLRCNAALSASQTRLAKGSVLRLRVDSTKALGTVTFRVPATTLRRLKGGRLWVRTAKGPAKRARLRRVGSSLVGARAPLKVTPGRGRVTVSGLPARAGIVRLNLSTAAKPLGSRGRTVTLRASATAGAKTLKLKARTRARR